MHLDFPDLIHRKEADGQTYATLAEREEQLHMCRAMGSTEPGSVPMARAEVGIQNGAPTLENGLAALYNFKHLLTM